MFHLKSCGARRNRPCTCNYLVETLTGECGSLDVGRVVEQRCQSYAAVTELGKPKRVSISRVEIRRGIVRREQHQRVEEVEQRRLLFPIQTGEPVSCGFGFATVSQDNLDQIDAAAIMAVRRSRSDTPQCGRQELSARCTVVIAFVEI